MLRKEACTSQNGWFDQVGGWGFRCIMDGPPRQRTRPQKYSQVRCGSVVGYRQPCVAGTGGGARSVRMQTGVLRCRASDNLPCSLENCRLQENQTERIKTRLTRTMACTDPHAGRSKQSEHAKMQGHHLGQLGELGQPNLFESKRELLEQSACKQPETWSCPSSNVNEQTLRCPTVCCHKCDWEHVFLFRENSNLMFPNVAS